MTTVLFAPGTFNLAETTRMIQVARALPAGLRPVFMGYEHDYVPLILEAGFDYRPLEPAWTHAQRKQAIDFDQGRTMRSPFSDELVAARVEAERALISELTSSRATAPSGASPTGWPPPRCGWPTTGFPWPPARSRG